MRGWQVDAAALSGGPGSLLSAQKEQEQTAVSEVLEPSHTEHRAVIFFFFFSPLEAKIVKQ